MTEILIVGVVAFTASLLTFFSGFGLGTVLLPVFLWLYPPPIAIAATGIVHLLNNVVKLALTGKYADWSVVFRFGVPGIVSALAGAWVLFQISGFLPLYTWSLGTVTWSGLVIGLVMLVFALLEWWPPFQKWTVEPRFIPLGGLLSGFFGGLSGHQGALRSAFLIRCNLTRDSFIATGVVIACLIDVSRLSSYFLENPDGFRSLNVSVLSAGILAAAAGAVLGNQLLKKTTIRQLQTVIAIGIGLYGICLALGLI